MRTPCVFLLFLLALVSWSCGNSQARTEQAYEFPFTETAISPTASSADPLQSTQEPTEMPPTPPVEKFVALAKKDLADRLGVEVDKIKLVKTAEKLWLNAALGCPRPGQFYAQGRVPGFQIWLEVEGTDYIYNTDFNGTVLLCPQLNPDVPGLDVGPTPGVPIR